MDFFHFDLSIGATKVLSKLVLQTLGFIQTPVLPYDNT